MPRVRSGDFEGEELGDLDFPSAYPLAGEASTPGLTTPSLDFVLLFGTDPWGLDGIRALGGIQALDGMAVSEAGTTGELIVGLGEASTSVTTKDFTMATPLPKIIGTGARPTTAN